jgi:hypothetical protein
MAKRSEKPALSVVTPAFTQPEPPRELGFHGRDLWEGVLAEFDIPDRGGLAVLAQACSLLDRAMELAHEIEKAGVMIPSSTGLRSNPSIKDEVACRTACVRCLEKLGILSENVRHVGRPPRTW